MGDGRWQMSDGSGLNTGKGNPHSAKKPLFGSRLIFVEWRDTKNILGEGE